MFISDKWEDFEVIDASLGEKLERWGDILLIRPDPQVVWEIPQNDKSPLWKEAHARYIRSNTGGGSWTNYKNVPDKWTVSYRDLKYNIKPMGFKHTGLFPEQAVNWDFIASKIKKSARTNVKVLNLFAYTGGATVAAAAAGAYVCHVDASKGMVSSAKENVAASALSDSPARYIVDDVAKFVGREIRRGNKYDAVIMDPPSYGRGPSGEVWRMEDKLFELVELCSYVLSDKPMFFIINSYTTGLSGAVLENILNLTIKSKFNGRSYSGEIGLPISNKSLILPCGHTGRWEDV